VWFIDTFRPATAMPCTLSVLIPTYNYGRYLPEAIDSVLGQDFTDFELLVSDDASTDDSTAVISHYAAKDPRVRFQLHPANLGMVANWNWCLQHARGDYVKYLFGDDCLASRHSLGRMVALLENNPGATMAATGRLVLDENSAVTGLWDDWGKTGLFDGPPSILRCLRANHNLIGEPSAAIFRRAAATRGFDPTMRQIVDLEMWFHLLLQGGFVYSPEPLCAFRRHGVQQTAINRQSRVGNIETVRLLTQYLEPVAQRTGLRPDSLVRRRIIFRSLYYVRKSATSHPQFEKMSELLQAQLPRRWWIFCWLLHRMTRPFENLSRSVRLRRLQKTAQVATGQLAFLRALRSPQGHS